MMRAGKALLVGAAVTGLLAATPMSAFAYPTDKTFKSHEACEKEARVIRDGIVGAECKFEVFGWRWRLHVYG